MHRANKMTRRKKKTKKESFKTFVTSIRTRVSTEWKTYWPVFTCRLTTGYVAFKNVLHRTIFLNKNTHVGTYGR